MLMILQLLHHFPIVDDRLVSGLFVFVGRVVAPNLLLGAVRQRHLPRGIVVGGDEL